MSYNRNIEQFLNSKALLKVDNQGRPAQRDLQVATAVLLMRMAEIEGAGSGIEMETVIASLGRQFSLEAADSAEIAEIARFLLKEKGGVETFVEILNGRFEGSQKVTIMAMLWKVMLADGLVTRLEAAYAADLCNLLGLGAQDVANAKALVAAGEV